MVTSIDSTGNLNQSSPDAPVVKGSDLFMACLQNFIEKFDKTVKSDEEAKQKEMIKELISAADTDNSGALSKDELSKVDLGDNKNLENFKNDLISNFDNYDKNKDGELSIDEMQETLKKKEFSIKELSEMAEAFKQNSKKEQPSISTASFEATLLNL